jgi:hypothetical protein
MYAGWRKSGVYCCTSVFIRVEKDFNSSFAPELLPKTLDDLNSAIASASQKMITAYSFAKQFASAFLSIFMSVSVQKVVKLNI